MSPQNINSNPEYTEDNSSLIEYCGFLKQRYKPNTKILFVQIPQFIFKSFDPEIARTKGYYAFPPTGLQYLYESLKERHLEQRILDLNLLILEKVFEDKNFDHTQWLTILADYLKSFKPGIIAISCIYDSGIQSLMQILDFLKRQGESVIITGGVIPSYEYKNLLSAKLCHFVIKGEGENKINYLFDHLTEENLKNPPTPEIYYNYQNRLIETKGPKKQVIVNTDLIHSYSLIEIEKYYKYGSLNPFSRIAGIDDSPFAAIQMNRGCRGKCTFCSVGDFIGKGIRKRPIEKVLAEMEFLINTHKVKHFEWLDDDLLFFKEDFNALLKSIINRKWPITWSANNGLLAASINDQLMQLMSDSGCIGFKIGIETGNADMLKKIRKPASLDTFRKTARIFDRYPKIFVGGNFMLGFPEEKFCQIMDTFRLALELELDWNAFILCQAIRGATAFGEFEDYFAAQINSGGKNTKNFIPARESSKGQINTKNNILKCLDVFKINPDSVPEEEQLKEIWLTFNIIANFINNKNLRPGGRIDKFIYWVEMAQVAYPTNPYMSLFLALAYKIKNNTDRCRHYHEKTVQCLENKYWRQILISFKLDNIINDFPKTTSAAFEAIEYLRKFARSYYL